MDSRMGAPPEKADLSQQPEMTASKVAHVAPADTLTPADRYLELFVAVQSGRIFSDSKTFVDCSPRCEPKTILELYRSQRDAPGFDLSAFVEQHFKLPQGSDAHYVSPPGQSLKGHIDGLWPVLTRTPGLHPQQSSMLQVPYDYVVPGGRFREIYYWDSYFTMIGLAASGHSDLLRAMTDNFAHLIDTFGHVPNGTRTYYLSRSQPPVFALMVELLERHSAMPGEKYLHQLRKEHAFWMDGADELRPGDVRRRVVRLESGEILNRYWDDRDTPREESFLEDVTTAKRSGRAVHKVYRNLRAAAESGWDFSSRWLAEGSKDMATIRTTRILPVDLNALLYRLETAIAGLSRRNDDDACAQEFDAKAAARHAAMTRIMWSQRHGAFLDYDWKKDRLRQQLSAASLAPLYVGLATPEQAQSTAAMVTTSLLRPGGIATTLITSGEQWDQPNGWAPLQWMAIEGLRRYGHTRLADEIAQRWLGTVSRLYQRESKLVEKYVMHRVEGGGGGEYPLQDGFGWTNGVVRQLLESYPRDPAGKAQSAESDSSATMSL